VTGTFFNPNIHPYEEHERRYASLLDYAARSELELIGEVFNLLNEENFWSSEDRLVESDGTINPDFNEVTNAGLPRRYQLGAKLRF